jgi:Pyridoxamine 5'-phosphate oxidase
MEMGTEIERGDGGVSQVGMGVMGMRLRKALARLLTRERVCRVATVGRDGMPHVVPVCHVLVDGKVCFGTGSGSQKVLSNVRPQLLPYTGIAAP